MPSFSPAYQEWLVATKTTTASDMDAKTALARYQEQEYIALYA